MEILKTSRLVLRNFRSDDAGDLFDYLRDPKVSCFLSLKLENMDEAKAEAEKRSTSDEYVAVCLNETDRLVGDLFAIAEEDTYSVGWNFNPDFGGSGLASEAVHALFAYLFQVKGARRLYAYVEDDNLPSQRLCERMHMRREGLFVEFVSFRNGDDGLPIYENTMQYAILRKEWEALPFASGR
ncbi:GNAT family protein [Rhizobium sp. AG855]|uniref:GNAT family N-acetyltransferase n=1 Tax=Rhizobium sp. AG855 TaxID=2183898 RepID=UPI000E76A045|nr:GNAT family protein [Rhizobium sp. AG855]RKE77431.1 RimJ/RimL family protein N-acetyltransferase [Rhizobium sp. AG855]